MLFENWTSPMNGAREAELRTGRDVVDELQHRASLVGPFARSARS